MTSTPIPTTISISPLLRKLSLSPDAITPAEITTAIDHIFTSQLSQVQVSALLTALHFTKLDERPDIIAAAAEGMRGAGLTVEGLEEMFGDIGGETSTMVGYQGGLVDIVGTGGDGHNTFNVSTTSAILATSCGLQICKHGNRASTSTSGSADILASLGAKLINVSPEKVTSIFVSPEDDRSGRGKFCFLFAPVFHPAMRHIAGVRKELGFKTIFNLLGPLVNPIDYSLPNGLEARIIGVGRPNLGRIFAETLALLGVKKGMVVCGDEGLDEVSIEVATKCWRLRETPGTNAVRIEEFKLHPTKSFGIKTHPLSMVAGGKSSDENAVILKKLVTGMIDEDEDGEERAILDFVLVNTAALLVVSGLCDGDEVEEKEELDEEGIAVGPKWKRAIDIAREGSKSGKAWKAWLEFVKQTL